MRVVSVERACQTCCTCSVALLSLSLIAAHIVVAVEAKSELYKHTHLGPQGLKANFSRKKLNVCSPIRKSGRPCVLFQIWTSIVSDSKGSENGNSSTEIWNVSQLSCARASSKGERPFLKQNACDSPPVCGPTWVLSFSVLSSHVWQLKRWLVLIKIDVHGRSNEALPACVWITFPLNRTVTKAFRSPRTT